MALNNGKNKAVRRYSDDDSAGVSAGSAASSPQKRGKYDRPRTMLFDDLAGVCEPIGPDGAGPAGVPAKSPSSPSLSDGALNDAMDAVEELVDLDEDLGLEELLQPDPDFEPVAVPAAVPPAAPVAQTPIVIEDAVPAEKKQRGGRKKKEKIDDSMRKLFASPTAPADPAQTEAWVATIRRFMRNDADTTPKPHQLAAFERFVQQSIYRRTKDFRYKGGAILGDQPGLGKTLPMLMFAIYEYIHQFPDPTCIEHGADKTFVAPPGSRPVVFITKDRSIAESSVLSEVRKFFPHLPVGFVWSIDSAAKETPAMVEAAFSKGLIITWRAAVRSHYENLDVVKKEFPLEMLWRAKFDPSIILAAEAAAKAAKAAKPPATTAATGAAAAANDVEANDNEVMVPVAKVKAEPGVQEAKDDETDDDDDDESDFDESVDSSSEPEFASAAPVAGEMPLANMFRYAMDDKTRPLMFILDEVVGLVKVTRSGKLFGGDTGCSTAIMQLIFGHSPDSFDDSARWRTVPGALQPTLIISASASPLLATDPAKACDSIFTLYPLAYRVVRAEVARRNYQLNRRNWGERKYVNDAEQRIISYKLLAKDMLIFRTQEDITTPESVGLVNASMPQVVSREVYVHMSKEESDSVSRAEGITRKRVDEAGKYFKLLHAALKSSAAEGKKPADVRKQFDEMRAANGESVHTQRDLSSLYSDLYMATIGAEVVMRRADLRRTLATQQPPLSAGEQERRLRAQVKEWCEDPAVVGESVYLDALNQICDIVAKRNEKLIFFYTFVHNCHIVAAAMRRRTDGLGVFVISPEVTDVAARRKIIEQFEAHEGPAVLITSIRVSGTGITINAASHALVDVYQHALEYDVQAYGRIIRVSQPSKVVTTWRVVIKHSIAEYLEARRSAKDKNSSRFFGEGDMANFAGVVDEDVTDKKTGRKKKHGALNKAADAARFAALQLRKFSEAVAEWERERNKYNAENQNPNVAAAFEAVAKEYATTVPVGRRMTATEAAEAEKKRQQLETSLFSDL